MQKRLVIMALAASVLFISPAGAAQLGGYPPPDNSIVADDASVDPGQDVTFTARFFQAGSPVTFTMFSAPIVLGTVDANTESVATLTAAIPCVPGGTHRVEASGTAAEDGSPLTVSTEITVADSSCAGPTTTIGGGDLPRTGTDSTLPLAQVGVGAVAAGGLLVLVARKRRSAGV